MKKITHIALSISLLAVFSCEKQNICPNTSREPVKSNWDNTDADRIGVSSKVNAMTNYSVLKGLVNSNVAAEESEIDTDQDILAGAVGGITDPNNDPDKGKKKGK